VLSPGREPVYVGGQVPMFRRGILFPYVSKGPSAYNQELRAMIRLGTPNNLPLK
jgi:hypothetical protein